jgi:hypothetical protein
VRRVRRAGPGRLVDGLQAHQPHQPPDPVTADTDTLPSQPARQRPGKAMFDGRGNIGTPNIIQIAAGSPNGYFDARN